MQPVRCHLWISQLQLFNPEWCVVFLTQTYHSILKWNISMRCSGEMPGVQKYRRALSLSFFLSVSSIFNTEPNSAYMYNVYIIFGPMLTAAFSRNATSFQNIEINSSMQLLHISKKDMTLETFIAMYQFELCECVAIVILILLEYWTDGHFVHAFSNAIHFSQERCSTLQSWNQFEYATIG